jgi:predicted protein tyrosine phosphatase
MLANIKKVLVVPRHYLEEMHKQPDYPADKCATIHIYSYNGEPLANLKGLHIKLHFDDITDRDNKWADQIEGMTLFNESHAKTIIDFLLDLPDTITVLFCSCDAGISRSGAVGEFAQYLFSIEWAKFHSWNPNILPNSYVKTLLFRELGKRDENNNKN